MPEVAALRETETILDRVLEVVRELAQEVGGSRAARATAPSASLERDLGLGSLERVELMVRLERVFGRSLGDAFLQLDTPADVARALEEQGGTPLPDARPGRAEAVRATMLSPAAAPTIHGLLWHHADADPERPTVFLREDEGPERTVSFGSLRKEAALVAGGLRERGVGKGDTVALMLPTSLDFLRSFMGILLTGAIPVPIYPPVRLDRLEEYARRQSAILADAAVRLLITIPRAKPVAAVLRPAVPSLRHVVTAQELADLGAGGAGWRSPEGSGQDPAFIQYTSGSTGHPKGVLLTHANLVANVTAIGRGLDARPTDVGVSWLPLYHDMGLIGSWLFCLAHGLPIAILSPIAFLARPERWLWTLHERRGTLSPAPNFAYELCVRRIPEPALEGLDLGSWRCALNGAEPVNPETLERFTKRFARYGFRPEAHYPVYGLAECSVAVCFPPPDRGPKLDRIQRVPFEREKRAVPASESDATALRFLSCGAPVPEHEVKLVDENGQEVPDRWVGRLAFRGPSMTPGYYRQPEATAAIRLAGGFYDSGDLAYRADGEIYVCGRIKDLIIKGGRNLVPQEIEEVAAEVEGIRRGCVVAIGVDHPTLGTESLVVVAETRATDPAVKDALAAAVTDRVAAALELPPDAVVLVPPGSVPKTSSGKIRRNATKELYLSGRLGKAEGTSLATRLGLLGGFVTAQLGPRVEALGRIAYGLWFYAAVLLVVAIGWPVLLLLPSGRPVLAFGRLVARLVLRIAGCRLSVEGLDRLPPQGSFLLASNHCSYVDVPALLALLPLDFLFVAKREVTSWPIVSTFVRKAGHILVERWEAPQSVTDAERVPAAVRAGRVVLVFPEGTFTPSAGLRPFRLGAFKTAVDTGAPIVPLALTGTRRVLQDGRLLPRPGAIRLRIGVPIAPQGEGWRAVVDLRDRVAAAIAEHCGEPVLDLVAAGPARE